MNLYFLLLLVFVLSPVGIIVLTERNKLASRIGSIIIAYGFGLVLGNIGLLPEAGSYMLNFLTNNPGADLQELVNLREAGLISVSDLDYFRIRKLQDLLLTLSIPLALPLLLFSLNIRSWYRMAGKAFISMLLSVFAILTLVFVCMIIWKDSIPAMDKISGMLVGLYTGGTPNLAALKMMLEVDADTYLKVHTYDMIPSLLYLLFLVSAGKNLFRKFLLPYPGTNNQISSSESSSEENAYIGFFRKQSLMQLGKALLISIIIFAVSGGISLLFPNHQMMVVILSITSLGILASLFQSVNKLERTFELGMYLILVFSVVVASMANFRQLVSISFELVAAISLTIFGALSMHTLLAKLFKVDADTLMVTSAALICSPPFVPMVAGALKNKEVIVSGLTVGIMGYAFGNYLGVLVTFLFSRIF